MMQMSVLIPAHNEAGYIGACLESLLASEVSNAKIEVLIIANGCRDNTVQIANGYAGAFATKDWRFVVIERAEGGKLGALNAGEDAATGQGLVYLDADVVVSASLLLQLATALDTDKPVYVSGTPRISPAKSPVTQAYARFWQTLPFVTEGVPGFGVFAMNAAGRARWNGFPDIISDDTYARLNFAPAERFRVPATYEWPMVEGFRALVKVRRRQNAGVDEIAALYPALMTNDDPKQSSTPVWRRFTRDPFGFAVYGAVALATRMARNDERWARGR